MNPGEVTQRYFASIRSRDLAGLMSLYAEDATFVLPSGRECHGVEPIREMHQSVFATASPIPAPLASVVSANSVAVEIESRLPDGAVRRTANFFYLNAAGQIQRISVYMRNS